MKLIDIIKMNMNIKKTHDLKETVTFQLASKFGDKT